MIVINTGALIIIILTKLSYMRMYVYVSRAMVPRDLQATTVRNRID